MHRSISHIATYLTVLAVCLQALVCAAGGRVCLRVVSSAVNEAVTSDCSRGCCGDHAAFPPASPPLAAAKELQSFPLATSERAPHEPCCLIRPTSPLTQQSEPLTMPETMVAHPAMSHVFTALDAADPHGVRIRACTADPPASPETEIVRAAVLRL